MTTRRAMNADTAPRTTADALRDALVAHGTVRSGQVEAAMRAVPRHLFLDNEPLEVAYADESIITCRSDDGRPLSSVSQPSVVATMLEQARLQSGERVLKIGAGKGYNAALLAHLVAPDGEVTTVDINPELVADARQVLTAVSGKNVHVVCADGEYGAQDRAPYSLVIVTVGAAELPPAWLDQLTQDGRIVVPLRLRGLFRLIAFEREDGHLVSRDMKGFGFVSMQGEGALSQRTVRLGGEDVRLVVDDGQPADAQALSQALTLPRQEAWTGVALDGAEGVLPSLDLWLASALDTYGRLHPDGEAAKRGVVGLTLPAGSSATWERDCIAYLTVRDTAGPGDAGRYELGACAYGPEAKWLAARLAEQVRVWDREKRSGPEAAISPGWSPWRVAGRPPKAGGREGGHPAPGGSGPPALRSPRPRRVKGRSPQPDRRTPTARPGSYGARSAAGRHRRACSPGRRRAARCRPARSARRRCGARSPPRRRAGA